MIRSNVDFHNVDELVFDPTTKAYTMLRLPKKCEKEMLEQGINMNKSSISVELRFKFEDEITFIFKSKEKEGTRVYLFIGEAQGPWDYSYWTIMEDEKRVTIKKNPFALDGVKTINKLKHSRFSSDVYRLIFDGSEVQFVGMEGKALPLCPEDHPSKKYLSYGSSITSNSITYLPTLSFPSLIAKRFGLDLINKGFSGSCRMEKEVADYLASFPDFEFATFEFGINVIGEWDEKTFEEKLHYFLSTVLNAHLDKTFYIIDIFSYFNENCGNVSKEKVENYRQIVKKELKMIRHPNAIYIRGDELLLGRDKLCGDLVHPDIDGHQEIYRHLEKIISLKYGKNEEEK